MTYTRGMKCAWKDCRDEKITVHSKSHKGLKFTYLQKFCGKHMSENTLRHRGSWGRTRYKDKDGYVRIFVGRQH